jgi:hypothetical protein
MALELARPAVVFVAFNPDGKTEPAWVAARGFEKLDEPLVVKGNVSTGWGNRKDEAWPYRVYAKKCGAGPVLLGANHGEGYEGGPGACMYAVAVKPSDVSAEEGPLVASIGYRLSPVPAAPEACPYLAPRPTLRSVPKGLEKAVLFQGPTRWPGEGWSLSVTASGEARVGVCVTGGGARAALEGKGLGVSGIPVELWEHHFLWGGWGDGYTMVNGYTGAAFAVLHRITKDEKYLKAALKLWETARTDPSDFRGDTAMLIADTEIHRIRRDPRLLDDAATRIERLLVEETLSWRAVGALADHVLAVPECAAAGSIRERLRGLVDRQLRLAALNPLGFPQHSETRFFPAGDDVDKAWALSMCRRVLGDDARLESAITACVDWRLGVNPYGVCLIAGAGSKHMERYWAYYTPEELVGSMSGGIVMGSRDADEPYLDMRPATGKRANGDGQTGEPSINSRFWMLMLSDR